MNFKYWKVVIRYGHVGLRNEVSVARYLEFPLDATISDVMNEVKNMPGTKNRCIGSIESISRQQYIEGKGMEDDNFYLQNLFSKVIA